MSRIARLSVWIALMGMLAACAAPTPASVSDVPSTGTPPPAVSPAGTQPAASATPRATVGAASAGGEAAFFTHPTLDPAVPHGPATEWDGVYTDPGAVVFHDGQFHMLRNGFRSWPATVQIGYVTSPDGITWTKQGTQPVMRTDQVPYAGTAALASSVLVQDDGTWVLYFYTWDNKTSPPTGAIGRATAPRPTGPWQPDPAPILAPGEPGEWDELHLIAPDVIRTAQGYRMYYSATSRSNAEMIGMATSPDGITWTKYDDPATQEAPFAQSDPVLRPGDEGTWDAGFVHQPRVVQGPDGWTLFYRAARARMPGAMALGFATGDDGIHWTRSANNPVLTAAEVKRSNFWFTNLLYHDGTYFLYWEVQTNRETNIHVATHTGSVAR